MSVLKWASIDDRSPWGDFWFEPVSRHSITGLRVGAEQAMRLAAVYACVRLLSKTFALMPFQLWEPQGKDARTPVTNHWINRLLGSAPNKFQNPFEFRQMLEGHMSLRGNAFCEIQEKGARILALVPKHPDRMKAELLPNDDYRFVYQEPDGSKTIYAREEIWHLRDLSNNGIFGLNPIELERDVVGLGLAAQEYGARFFANDATPPGWIEHPGQFKDKTARENYRESLQIAQTGKNRGKSMVLEAGQKYHPLEVKNSDAQYLESRRFTVSEIARVFGVPPHLIGDLDRATFANIEQQSLEYVLYTMAPIAAAWAAAIKFALLGEDVDLAPGFGLEELLRGDQATRAAFYTKMFGIGALSTNDIILKEGGNPVKGGDMRFRPVNLTPLDPDDVAKFAAAGVPPPSPGAPAPDGGDEGRDPDEEQDQRQNGRAAALASAAAARVARKEVGMLANARPDEVASLYAQHAQFVADALAIGLDRARAYVRTQLEAIGGGITASFETNTRARLTALALESAA